MNWFPTFLSGWTGIIAAAIAVPALLILYFLKLRRREFAVSSTLLWRKAVQDLQVNSPFQKLRKNLLLLLQLLLLALLCFALSRPVVNANQKPGNLTVILIDRSASMAAKDAGEDKNVSRLSEAKRLAKDLVAAMGRDDKACVVAFDETAETLCPLTSDQARLRNAINTIEQTDRPTRMKLAYQLADAQASFNPDQLRQKVEPDIFLYSDGRALDSASLTTLGKIKFQQLGSEQTANAAIVALSAKRNYERPTEVQVFARLNNFGPEPIEADVNLHVATEFSPSPAFQLSKSAAVFLYPDRWTDKQRDAYLKAGNPPPKESVEFKLDLTTAAVIKLEKVAKAADALPADDIAHVVVGVEPCRRCRDSHFRGRGQRDLHTGVKFFQRLACDGFQPNDVRCGVDDVDHVGLSAAGGDVVVLFDGLAVALHHQLQGTRALLTVLAFVLKLDDLDLDAVSRRSRVQRHHTQIGQHALRSGLDGGRLLV